MRPLCAANRAPNSALGNLISRATRALGDSISNTGGEIVSTEELKRLIQDFNRERQQSNQRNIYPRRGKEIRIQSKDNLVVYSMDVTA